jgi:hypothetical protein
MIFGLLGSVPRSYRGFSQASGGIVLDNRVDAVGQCALLAKNFADGVC